LTFETPPPQREKGATERHRRYAKEYAVIEETHNRSFGAQRIQPTPLGGTAKVANQCSFTGSIQGCGNYGPLVVVVVFFSATTKTTKASQLNNISFFPWMWEAGQNIFDDQQVLLLKYLQ